MKQDIIFGKWEGACLLITMIGTKVVLNYPRLNVETAGTAGWILAIYSGILALLAFLVIAKLYSPFQGKDLIDVAEQAGGGITKIFVGIIIVIFFLALISASLRQFSEQMKGMAFWETPISFITLLFLLGTMASAYMGLEAIVRFQAILVPVSIAAFLIYLVGLAPEYTMSSLCPLLGNGSYRLFVNGALKISQFSELLLLFLLVPYLKRIKDVRAAGSLAIGLSTFFMASLTAAYIGVYTYPAALTSYLPAFEMGRLINYGRFFQNAEAILVITWATMGFMYLSGGFYFIVYIFARTFKIDYYRPLIPAFGVLLFALSLVPQSLLGTLKFLAEYFRTYSWIVTFVFPIVLLIVARIRIKRGKKI